MSGKLRKIYLASSWRNERQPQAVQILRDAGHEVYDFRNPAEFTRDKAALDWCDTCILLLPCDRSAHLEARYAIGQGKSTLIVYEPKNFELELMYLLADNVACGLADMLPKLNIMK